MNEELPDSWAWARVSEITEAVPNVKPEDYPSRTFGYVDISSIDNATFTITELKQFKGKDAPSRARRPVRPNDVLFSNVRTYLRNVALVPDGLKADLCSTGFTVLRPGPAVMPRYLFRYVLSHDFIDRVTPQQTGTHYPATSDRVVMGERIPLPPIAEQRRIVLKLEHLLGKVDACQQRLAKIPVLLKRFRQSVLAAACSGRLTADWRDERPTLNEQVSTEEFPKTWAVRTFGDVVESSFYGPRFSAESYSDKGVPTIRTTDMSFDGAILLTDSPRISLSKAELERFALHDGDLLVTRTGATIGKCAIYDQALGPAIPSAYLIRFRFKREAVVPKFVLRFLMSPAGQALLVGGSTAVAQPNVNATTIGQFVIPLPALDEQQEIVRRIDDLFTLADRLEAKLVSAQAQVNQLVPAMLARAFRGKLVASEAELACQERRDYEPASVLLERIRRERDADSARPKASPGRRNIRRAAPAPRSRRAAASR